MKAIVILGRDNVNIDRVGEWVPLEIIFSSYLDMIDQGHIGLWDIRQPWQGEGDRCGPWVLSLNIDVPLQRTLEAWETLLTTIEARLPNSVAPTSTPDEPREIPTTIPGDFIRSFLQKARLPSFRYIAPGLQIPTLSSLTSQSFQNRQSLIRPGDRRSHPDFPVLLFSFDHILHTDKRQIHNAHGYTWPSYPWHNVDAYETGLYLLPEQVDRCHLLLPYSLNEGHARRGDGGRIKA